MQLDEDAFADLDMVKQREASEVKALKENGEKQQVEEAGHSI